MIKTYVDPDTKLSGWCEFDYDSRSLCYVALIGKSVPSDWLKIEKPQIYPGVSGIDPNDLVDLAIVVGTWVRLAEHVELVTAREWKGSRKKPHMHLAAWEALDKRERLLVARAGNRRPQSVEKYIRDACESLANGREPRYAWQLGEVLDAVCMGLIDMGRMR